MSVSADYVCISTALTNKYKYCVFARTINFYMKLLAVGESQASSEFVLMNNEGNIYFV